MAVSLRGLEIPMVAGADLSASQYHFVDLASDGQVDTVSVAGARQVGVLQNAPAAAGRAANVRRTGTTKVVVGTGGSTVGARASVAVDGTAVLALEGEPSVGIFMDAVSATEIAELLLDGTSDPGAGVQTIRGTLTAAQIQTLNATPVALIAAPGAGKFVQVDSVHWMLDYGTAAYDAAAAGDDLAVKYTDGSGAKLTDDVDHSGFFDATNDEHRIVTGVAVEPVANAAVVAHILSTEVYGAAGDSPIHYEISYRVRTLDIS